MKMNRKYNMVKVRWMVILFTIHCSLFTVSAQRMDNVPEHSKYIQAVDEYRPAPGQFVNDAPEYEEGDTEADMIRKCNERIAGKGPTDVDAHIESQRVRLLHSIVHHLPESRT